MPVLKTARFTMRPLERGDEAALFPTLGDPEQCRFLTRPAFTSEEELWAWLTEPGWPGRTWIAVDREGPRAGEVAGRFVAMPGHGSVNPQSPRAYGPVFEIGYITARNSIRM